MSEIPIKCFSASAVLLKYENDNAKVLLLRRNEGSIFGNEWCHIAGDIEKGETAWQAVLREIKEETGLQPEILYSANFCEQYYRPDLECISVLPVFVGIISDNQSINLNYEHTEYKWVTISEARKMVVLPVQRFVLDHIQKAFIDNQPSEWLKIELTHG